jgi:mono/diheme cytochrome c family protein
MIQIATGAAARRPRALLEERDTRLMNNETTRPPRPAALGLAIAILSLMSGAQAAPDVKQVAAGEQIYSDYCSNCHGEGLKNTSGGVTFDLRRLRPEDRDRFFSAVLDGKRQMPPWRGALEMEQIEAIWVYIRATVDR